VKETYEMVIEGIPASSSGTDVFEAFRQ
jgi:hypothetical protein